MTGIQFVTDEQGRKVGVLIDLKKHRAIWERLLGWPCVWIAPQRKGNSLRAIPHRSPKTRPPTWIGIRSKSSSPRKGN